MIGKYESKVNDMTVQIYKIKLLFWWIPVNEKNIQFIWQIRRETKKDEFLKIVGMNHSINSGTFKELQPETEQFKEVLGKYVGESIYNGLLELLDDAITTTNEYAFVEDMKTAIAITEKSYKAVP